MDLRSNSFLYHLGGMRFMVVIRVGRDKGHYLVEEDGVRVYIGGFAVGFAKSNFRSHVAACPCTARGVVRFGVVGNSVFGF